MRSAICLPVCELALSLSFPEVQPRAPAVYNTIEIPIVCFCGEVLDKGETNSRGANQIQLLKTPHAWRTSNRMTFFSFAAEEDLSIDLFLKRARILGCKELTQMPLIQFLRFLRKFPKIPNF
jgi:hypothetical protein